MASKSEFREELFDPDLEVDKLLLEASQQYEVPMANSEPPLEQSSDPPRSSENVDIIET